MKASDIRSRFLEFFRERGHEVVPSSPVIPHGDRTLLFSNAGMNQFKDVFVGRETRSYSRATSSQKCIRAGGKHNDLENVGQTARHHTFFEMLGNFSFGDYFKKEAIAWSWELSTKVYGMPEALIHATVFEEDDEAYAIWRDEVGLPEDRLHRLGAKDNFWAMGDTGPCGPCSELHYDRGEANGCGPKCALGVCDCDRWMEYYNLVFMQFDQAADGTRTPLPKPSVDTGMGLERVAMLLQGKPSNYETDLLMPLIEAVAERSGVPYDSGPSGMPHRVLADHVRALTTAITDGAVPGNKDRGYVLRRILRRAARFGRQLQFDQPIVCELVPVVVEVLGDAFPELRERQEHVVDVIRREEVQFNRTLDRGINLFEEVATGLEGDGAKEIPGAKAFELYDTYGFPVDLTQLMARERQLTVDMAGFEAARQEAVERSRAAGGGFKAAGLAEGHRDVDQPTEFTGYDATSEDGASVLSATDGEIILDRSPFYAEGGGQMGDAGRIRSADAGKDGAYDFEFVVSDTQKLGDVFVHRGEFVRGDAAVALKGAPATAAIDADRREAIEKNHSATHILHWALREILGDHARQRGSLVAPTHLRFDYEHRKAVAAEELEAIERLINERVVRDVVVGSRETSLDDAMASGVMAIFGEKYGEDVRVIDIGGFSKELCGGTHCRRTGEIGYVKIGLEKKIGADIRRIEAKTGLGSVEDAMADARLISALCRRFKTDPASLEQRVEQMFEQVKELRSKKQQSASKDLGAVAKDLVAAAQAEGALFHVIAHLKDHDPGSLRQLGDRVKSDGRPLIGLFANESNGKVNLLAAVSKVLQGKGGSARALLAEVAPIVGGKGGGRDDMAQGGGTDPSKIPEALERAHAVVKELAAKV